ncbi:MAG TPA: N-acetyltransferase [Motilibacteraceae bacterium]|nr:N-acetyltransferase [Motilibacteraceae bacterium]
MDAQQRAEPTGRADDVRADDVVVRQVRPEDWAKLRDLRLEMLADTPLAYLETLADARTKPEADWRQRARRGAGLMPGHPTATFVAEGSGGCWLGQMAGYVDAPGSAMLVAVYVAPSVRGRAAGVADALLDAVVAWARQHAGTLRLLVHEDNARARAFYLRRGFTETGRTEPYELDPSAREIEMALLLPDPGGEQVQ